MKTPTRDLFQSYTGFILACIGSSVGIGNVWLFPWRVGEFGGAVFLLLYFFFVVVLGVVGLIGEFALGRRERTGPIGAFEKALQTRNISWGAWIGTIPMLGAWGIATGYAIVVGWVLRFLVGAVDGSLMNSEIESYFGVLVGDFGSVVWHLITIAGTVCILLAGVSKGIEKVNKIMMPLFYILFIILLIRVFTLPNIQEGINYLLIPQWDILKDPKAWAIALGQAFFSLSLAGSGMVVYGSYLKDDVNMVDAAIQTALYSTIGALFCAFVIIPAVFSFGLDPTAGPPLVFISLPLVFQQMFLGRLFAILFFLSVLFAAITSLLNLMECPIEALQNRFKISRLYAVLIVGFVMFGIGIFLENVNRVGAWMDIISIYIVPIGASLSAIMIFWVLGIKTYTHEIEKGLKGSLPSWFHPLARYVFVGVSLCIIVLSFFKAL
ncbi:MAG: sodium-dependent transporter [Brevinema sp.]